MNSLVKILLQTLLYFICVTSGSFSYDPTHKLNWSDTQLKLFLLCIFIYQ